MLWFIWFSGTTGVLLRKVNGTAIIQLPSKQQVQVSLSFWIKIPPAVLKPWSALNWMLSSQHTHRYWRPAWWLLDACPTSTTINGSLAKPAATAGSASALRAACGREREAGQDARLNRCLRWRSTSTFPPSPLRNTLDCLLSLAYDEIMFGYKVWIKTSLYRRLKILLNTTACESMERNKTI